MVVGMVVQTFVLTGMCLLVYIVGLIWNLDGGGHWDPAQVDASAMTDDEKNTAISRARTMTILYIVFAELLRSYSARALRVSVFGCVGSGEHRGLGLFTNRYLQYAVSSAVLCTIAISLIPGVCDVFSMVPIDGREWGLVIGLAPVPFAADEFCKAIYRATGFGARPKIAVNGSTVAVTTTATATTTTTAPATFTPVTVIAPSAAIGATTSPVPSHAIDITQPPPQQPVGWLSGTPAPHS